MVNGMPKQRMVAGLALAGGLMVVGAGAPARAAEGDAPLMRDFMGFNIHAVQIMHEGPDPADIDVPALFRPTGGLVRDYHGMNWDVANPSDRPVFPYGHQSNWINWDELYGGWVDAGYRINAAIQFSSFSDEAWFDDPNNPDWDDAAANARAYGEAFAAHFGSAVGNGLVESIQIGNEPGHMSDEMYAVVFRNMAEGVRAVDPDMLIVTPNVQVGPSGDYHKSLDIFEEMTHLVDVYATHSYSTVRGWPYYERSHPEDSTTNYLTSVQAVNDWRDQHAAEAQVWVTEFGYEATSQESWDSDWSGGVTETEQARYLVRSFLAFAGMEVDRAYMFWFNDNDNPQQHGSSGLTRHYEPKPSFWAMSHMHEMLADYYFTGAVSEVEDELYVYGFAHESDPGALRWVLWSPTGSDREVEMTLDGLPGEVLSAELMPLAEGSAPLVDFDLVGEGAISLLVGESPIYLSIHVPEPTTAVLLGLGGLALLTRSGRAASRVPASC